MADVKITALAVLTAADPINDAIPIVDVSDTTMAASGTTKRISVNNILGASGTATLASATITGAATVGTTLGVTGNLTVGTNALIVFPATNRVLINQTAAIQGDALEISAKSDGGTISLFGRASDNGASLTFRANGVTTAKASLTASDSGLSIRTGTVERYNIDTTGVSTWSVAGTTAMTLNASGLGLGTATFGTSAAKVLAIGTGTEPTTGPAGTVQLFTSTRSASNTIPAIFTEGSGVTNAAITNTTVTNKIAIKVNGTIYYLLATTSAA
jgi:hypothetical protein